MTRVHYCETCYYTNPPVDVNPLIWQAFPKGKILVLCTREGMLKRVTKLVDTLPYPSQKVDVAGIWNLDEVGLVKNKQLDRTQLKSYDVVVILGRDRAHEIYQRMLQYIEAELNVNRNSA